MKIMKTELRSIMKEAKKLKNPIFIDSGAHGLYNEHVIKKNHSEGYAFFKSQEFFDYVDTYAEFIKANKDSLEIFANVDAIFNPEITWEVQQYIEKKHKLRPMPVIHYGTDLKWLHKYIDLGYDYIALGGLGQEVSVQQYVAWADAAFNIICDQHNRLPKVKVHGFAVTSLKLMRRYPWYSVDSASWRKYGAYGMIVIPPFIDGKWCYTKQQHVVKCSHNLSPGSNMYLNLHGAAKQIISVYTKYIHEKGFKLGKSELKEVPSDYNLQKNERWLSKIADGKATNTVEVILEKGVINNDTMRYDINAMYFIDVMKSIPKWPWPFIQKSQKTLSI